MTRSARRRARLLLSITALALALAALSAAAAGAAPVKPYVAVVSNAAPPAQAPDPAVDSQAVAGSRTTLHVTLYNYNDQQSLGSANVTVPGGLSLVSTSLGSIGTAGGATTIQLRDLALPKDTSGGTAPPSVTFTVTVDASCAAGGTTATWAVVAKQSNNFNGPPGNGLTAATSPPSSLATRVTGTCRLAFVAQPNDAVVGETITSTPFGTPPTSTVSVEVLGGDDQRVTSSSIAITLTRSALSLGLGAVSGGTATASAGLATFPSLRIDAPGTYALDATATGVAGDTSDFFTIAQSATACEPGVTCTTSAAGGDQQPTKLSVTAPPASGETTTTFLTASFGLGAAGAIHCADTLVPDDHTALVDSTSTLRNKVVTLTIAKYWVNLDANNGASFLPVCFGAPVVFRTAGGTDAQPQGTADFNGDGIPEVQYVGLLPACGDLPAGVVQACVSKRNKTGSGVGVITVQLPSVPGDPKMHG